MAGITEGFEYDIFISSLQKDNRQDGYVTDINLHFSHILLLSRV